MREGEQVRTDGKTETDMRENVKPVKGDIKMDGKKRHRKKKEMRERRWWKTVCEAALILTKFTSTKKLLFSNIPPRGDGAQKFQNNVTC